ncbi:MAG: shikimate dehydrogenase [Bacteroidaceae bacterium]|nr:shikimate dehydrogenase [Bacteroidaceae bacterium]
MQEYGLLGYPLGHSFSRAFFTEKFAQEHLDAVYLNFELPRAEMLLQVLDEHPNLRGLNVTIPHKQAVIPLLDELSDEARAIGAVNVIRVGEKNGRRCLKGFNSDIIGFTQSLRPLLRSHHRKALVLGTGGASRAICHGLQQLGIEWRYVSRTPREGHFTYSSLTPAVLSEYTIIVNCSPVGMYPKEDVAPTLAYAALSPRHLLYDLVYNPELTLFLKQGRRFGATIKGGLEMLHLQALASWEFWNGKE